MIIFSVTGGISTVYNDKKDVLIFVNPEVIQSDKRKISGYCYIFDL